MKEIKSAYLSNLNARFNPDILIGSEDPAIPSFIRGNEYFSINEEKIKKD